HPGGSLGRALIRVCDIMHRGTEMPLVTPDSVMREVLLTMTSGGFGVAGVVDGDGSLIGVITDGDLRRHMERDLLDRRASDVMTKSPKTIGPNLLAAEALALMNNATPRVTNLFVVERGTHPARPLGILHVHDCLRAGLR